MVITEAAQPSRAEPKHNGGGRSTSCLTACCTPLFSLCTLSSCSIFFVLRRAHTYFSFLSSLCRQIFSPSLFFLRCEIALRYFLTSPAGLDHDGDEYPPLPNFLIHVAWEVTKNQVSDTSLDSLIIAGKYDTN